MKSLCYIVIEETPGVLPAQATSALDMIPDVDGLPAPGRWAHVYIGPNPDRSSPMKHRVLTSGFANPEVGYLPDAASVHEFIARYRSVYGSAVSIERDSIDYIDALTDGD